ncbi:MAG: N utilization substance protein A [Candidatus Paceibacteria bacterium]|jgi:N utilization substance protein A
MFDLKVINSVLGEMEEERGIPRERMLAAMEEALATAYRKEFGKRGQILTCAFDMDTGTTTFNQIKIVVDASMLKPEPERDADGNLTEAAAAEASKQAEKEAEHRRSTRREVEEEVDADGLVRFDEEKHIMIETAKMIKAGAELGEELVFPLEPKDDFGRIAAQTAKQVIMQKIREAEKDSALTEFGEKAGEIITGQVQRFERGNLYVDLGRVTAIMPYDEQIPGERFKPGDRIRAILLAVEETPRGIFLKLSRSHPDFLVELFAIEAPELQAGTVEVKSVAREAGARTKIAVHATDTHIDPVGSLVGQRGVRVSTVMSELGGEKIDIIEWSPESVEFIEDALSPAQVIEVRIEQEPNEETNERGHAVVEVAGDQQSLAIGRGGQNVRLAAKLTGWKIDIMSANTGEDLAEANGAGDVTLEAPSGTVAGDDADVMETDDATTTKPDVEEVLKETGETQDRDVYGAFEENDVDTPEEAEKQLAEAEDGNSTLGEALVEVADMAAGNMTDGLESQADVDDTSDPAEPEVVEAEVEVEVMEDEDKK